MIIGFLCDYSFNHLFLLGLFKPSYLVIPDIILFIPPALR